MVKLTILLTVYINLKLIVTFPTVLVVFGKSQCTGSADQSEQTVLVGRRGFVEKDAFERGGA